jgi:hypothetical protein
MNGALAALLGTIATKRVAGGGGLVNSGVFTKANGAGTVTLGWTPTSGNYLFALLTHWSNNPTVNTGWTQFFTNNGGSNAGLWIGYRLLDGTDTHTQEPVTSPVNNGITYAFFEISGIDITSLQQTNFKEDTSSTTETLSITADGDNSTVVGMFTGAGVSGQSVSSSSGATFGTPLLDQTFDGETPVSIVSFNTTAANGVTVNAELTFGVATDMYGIIIAVHP